MQPFSPHDEIILKCKKLADNAILPSYAMEGDAGLDLYGNEDVVVPSRGRAVVGTGIAIEIPKGRVGLVHPRSGLAAKSGITVLNAPGTIDSGYRGEVKVILVNHSDTHVGFMPGDRIAQLVIQRFTFAHPLDADELEETTRGEGGFGSTGVSGRTKGHLTLVS